MDSTPAKNVGIAFGDFAVSREITYLWTAAFFTTLLVFGLTLIVLHHMRAEAAVHDLPPSSHIFVRVGADPSADESSDHAASGEVAYRLGDSPTVSLLLEFQVDELQGIVEQLGIMSAGLRKDELVVAIICHISAITQRQAQYMMYLRDRGRHLEPPVKILPQDVMSKHAASAWIDRHR